MGLDLNREKQLRKDQGTNPKEEKLREAGGKGFPGGRTKKGGKKRRGTTESRGGKGKKETTREIQQIGPKRKRRGNQR